MWRIITRRAFSARPVTPRATQLLINGKFQPAVSGKTMDVYNPATERVIAQVAEGDAADVALAVDAARAAFDSGPWRKMSGSERGQLMYRLADLIEKNAEELAVLESMDNGKPVTYSRAADLALTISTFRYHAGLADKIHGETIPISGNFLCYTRKEPVGVAGQIIPWNFPLLMACWKLGPVLAAGCTAVLKPAEQTPLTALRLGELIMEAGFPKGVVNVISGYGETAGNALVVNPKVDKIAFTGSTEVGKLILKNSASKNLKRLTLELGGKSPNIIMDDANIDDAIAQTQLALFFNQGQCCIAGSRVYVHERIYDEFVARSVAAAKARKMGDPLDDKVEQGPQVDRDQMNKIMQYIDSGKQQGANLATGGHRWGKTGYYVEPTIFTDCNDDMKIAREEIFGPVMSVFRFRTVDEVIRRANDSNYGLGAGVMTKNLETALKFVNELRVGTVYVNCYDEFRANTPFGGYKDSGIGRELGLEGIKNYLELKTVIMRTAPGSLP